MPKCKDKFKWCKKMPEQCGFWANPRDCPATCCKDCDCTYLLSGKSVFRQNFATLDKSNNFNLSC